MDTDDLIRTELRANHPLVDVDAGWADVQRRTRRARRRTAVLATVALAIVVGGVALVLTMDDGPDSVEVTNPVDVTDLPTTPEAGDAATWTTDPSAPPSPEVSSIPVLVTRLGCSGGETGRVLRPGVEMSDEEVVITFTVAAIGEGAFTCPGNDAVPFVVDLGQPLGDRALVDGGCTAPDGAGGTSSCEGGAVRWPLEGGDPYSQ